MNTKETRDEITTGATGRQPDTPDEDGLTLDTYPSYYTTEAIIIL